MTVYELMAKMGAAGIKLWVEEGQLKFKAPKGALTADLKSELIANKQSVIDFLNESNLEAGKSGSIPVVDRSKPIPLSQAQQRLWFVEQLTPGSSTFHIPAALYLKGILDYKALENAFSALIQRHETLRTVFVTDSDRPFQVVKEASGFHIEVESLLDVPEAERNAEVTSRVEREVRKSFDLEKGPLIRAKLYKLDDNKHGLIVTMHHIITDGWSMGIFVREISALYASQRMGMKAPLPELEIQYGDYSCWQREWLQGNELDRQLSYWRKRLGGAAEQLALPFDRARPALQTLNGSTADVTISAELSKNLRKLAREFDTTLYIVLMTAYNIVLSKWAKQADVCVGMPVAGRTRPEVENLIGFFVNTLVIRSKLDGNPTVSDLIKQIKENVLGAQSHQDLPFEAIVEELNVARNLSFAPIYQVAFSLTSDEGTAKKATLGGLEIEPMPIELVAARLDLTLMLVDDGNFITGMLEYNTDLFDSETINRFLLHLETVLTQMSENINHRIESLSLLSQDQLINLFDIGQEIDAVFPLAPMQRDFCLDSLREPETTRNSIGYAVRMPFNVDQERWKVALQKVNQANPFLRSRVVTCDYPGLNSLYQLIVKSDDAILERITWQGEALSEESVVEQLESLTLQSWQVEGQPLWKHYLIDCVDGSTWAVSAAHHSVSDGVTKYNHFTQTISAYMGESVHSQPLQNASDWVAKRVDVTDTGDTLQFWRDQISDYEPVAVKARNSGKVVAQSWRLSNQELEPIHQWCKSHGVGFAGYLRTLYSLALQQCYYDADSFVLIDAVAGRATEDDLWAGCAFQFVPFLQTKLTDVEDSFSRLVQCNRQWKKSIGDRQYLSMYKRKGILDSNALEFQFNYRLPAVGKTLKLFDNQFRIHLIQPDNAGTVKLLITTKDDGIAIRLSYHDKEFKGFNLIERMKSVHGQILSGVDKLSDLNWVLPEEESSLLKAGRGMAISGIPDFLAEIERQAKEHPNHHAVICSDNAVTYEQLWKQSNQIAAWLLGRGITAGEKVAICVSRRKELPALYLGVVKSPAAYVPMDSAYPAERIQHILADSNAKVFITERCILESLEKASVAISEQVEVILLEDLDVQLSDVEESDLSFTPDASDLLYFVYTSGSTGKPKGAGVYHSGESNLLQWYQGLLQSGPDDKILLASAMGFDLTQKNLYMAFYSGATLVIPERDEYDPEVFAKLIDQHRVTVINCAPSAFYPLLDDGFNGYPYISLKHVVLGGEPIRSSAVKNWLNDDRVVASITNSYGPTECTDVVAAYSFNRVSDDGMIIPIGNAIQNTQLFLTNKNGGLMPAGASGELRVAGAGVGDGYWKQDELTNSVFLQNSFGEGRWYRTGDICRFDENDQIVYVGRTDFQLKLRGLRIEPDEINNQLKAISGIHDALTLVLDEQLVSYVLLDAASNHEPLSSDSIKQLLRKHLPEFMVPASLVFVKEWPLTPNGKIDRKALPKPKPAEETEYVEPRNEGEQKIADIWGQVLKLSKVSVKANFFEIGGHSLLATQVVSRIRKAFGVELSVRTLFEAPTIEKLVHSISTASAAGLLDSAPPLQPLEQRNRDTLSFAQYRLWFVDQLNQGSSEYNLPSAMRIKGSLNIDVLNKVFIEIINRHEVLRTNFDEVEGIPKLLVHENIDWDLKVVDLTGVSAEDQDREVARLVDDDAARVYSLKNDALFTAQLLKLAENDFVLVMNMHHIISDGWSLGVLVQEIQALYPAFAAGQGSPLPPLPIQYSDFAVWQRNWIQGDVLDSLRDYWQEALRGAPDVLRLPTDKPRPKHQTFNGAHYPTGLGKELSARVNKFCEQHDQTPFMVLMGCYQILLSRNSNQKDICVGIPIAGRNRAETEGLIGFFINGLVIRTQMGDNPDVLDYLNQVKSVSLGAYAHQDMPADLLLDAIKMERTADTSPGAQVGFALQNVAQESLNAEMAGLTIEPVEREHRTAKYELSLILQENNGEFAGVAEYNTDLFLESTIARMMEQFCLIVEQVIEQPNLQLDQLQLVQESEYAALLNVDSSQFEIKHLSPMQRDMYLDSLANPDTLKNSLGYHFITAGEFDIDLWQQAIQTVVNQQPLLRATILPSNIPYMDVAYLKIKHNHTVKVICEDWSDREITDAAAATHAKELIWQPYDIEGELSQYFVIKLNNNRHMVVFRMNHIILDGSGMAVHLNNCISAAEALKQGVDVQTAPLIYEQYVEDSRNRFDSSNVIRYWQNKGSQVEALDFSLPNSALGEPAVRVEKKLPLSPQHWSDINTFCKNRKITPSLYFKAIYGLLINSYCRGETDFYISEVVGGRVGQHKRVFGNYFQVLPIVFEQALLDKQTQLTDLFNYIRQYRKALRTNANVSLLMQRQTLPQGRLNFMFNYYNFIPSVSLFGTPVDLTAYPQVQDGPVQFVVQEQDGNAELSLIYMSDLFDDLEFLQRFEQISQQITQGASSVSDLTLLLPTEQTQKLEHAPVEMLSCETVIHGFVQQAAQTPNNIAIKCGEHSVTYTELDQQSNRLANWLISQGVESGDRVAICLDRNSSLVLAIYGCLKAGAIYVPMDSNYPEERLAYIVEDSEASILITQRCVRERLTSFTDRRSVKAILELDADIDWQQADNQFNQALPTKEDAIYIIYTSGSTGKPKGAMVTHTGEMNLQQWYLQCLNLQPSDRFLLMSASGFDLTQKNFFAPLLVGACLVIPEMEQYDVDVIAQTITNESITVINCAPSAFYPVVENSQQQGYPFNSLKYLVLGGEPIRIEALKPWLQQSSCQLINSYGPTECTDVVAYHRWNAQSEQTTIPIGKPINNTQLYVVDHADHPLPVGIVGELCVAGTGVGLGYLNKPDLNEAAFQQNPYGQGNWYRTGDLVRLTNDREFEYIGRKDFQIKLRGLRIELGEIESSLQACDNVIDSLTQVKDDRLISYVVTSQPVDANEIKQKLRQSLPDYMVPSAVVSLSSWPLTPNGKIDRDALPDPEDTGRPEYVAPRNETEEKLVAIWSEVLGVEKIGVHDSFFDLGGHSLLAARAVSKFRQAFEIDIQLRSLFELHTVADIAQYVETMQWAARSAEQAKANEESSEGREEGLL